MTAQMKKNAVVKFLVTIGLVLCFQGNRNRFIVLLLNGMGKNEE